jgi:hypothetical protein
MKLKKYQIHLIVAFFYLIACLFIVQDESIGIGGRAGIVAGFIFTQFFTALFNYDF